MRLIEHFPEFLRESPEFADIQNALEPEITALRARLDDMALQLDLETATWGLELWEKTLGLPVVPESGTETRRSKVRARLRGAGTATKEAVKAVVAGFTGGEVTLIEHPGEFRLELKFQTDRILDLRALSEALREFLPAHLIFWLEFSASEAEAILRLGGTAGLDASHPGAAEAAREVRSALAMGGPPGAVSWINPRASPQPAAAARAVISMGGPPGAALTSRQGSPRQTAAASAVLAIGGAPGAALRALPRGSPQRRPAVQMTLGLGGTPGASADLPGSPEAAPVRGTVRTGGTGGIQSTATTAAEERQED